MMSFLLVFFFFFWCIQAGKVTIVEPYISVAKQSLPAVNVKTCAYIYIQVYHSCCYWLLNCCKNCQIISNFIISWKSLCIYRKKKKKTMSDKSGYWPVASTSSFDEIYATSGNRNFETQRDSIRAPKQRLDHLSREEKLQRKWVYILVAYFNCCE